MMKSAIDWLMGKSEALSINNDLNSLSAATVSEHENSSSDKDSSKENSLLNGHFSGDSRNRNVSISSPTENPNRSTGEETRSPWGRTLTPKGSKYSSQISQNSPSRHTSHSLRMSPPMSWEDMSFTSDVVSPGFTSRIAKEARGGRKLYDGSRRYPIGQEKYIRAGVLPNVRLKGRSKPVVMTRRAPSSPLLPLSSPSSPFSSSSLASGFLASASTRMPDISSVVSVLDSTPSTSAFESIKDPTSVQAVVAALEQAQNLKSGIKRSRYGETEDSNKKQKCTLNSSMDSLNDFATPVTTQAYSSSNTGVGGGGEKRALDLSPPNSAEGTPDGPQLSPENKRRCIPDPRIASFSSSKNFNNYNHNSSGRETPFSMYESHQDSDSESNKSMESHQSKQSERSFRVQNHDVPSGRISSQENFDRSGSQTPQSVRGSYGIAASNGSSSSSRTTTPSKPSHIFSLEAYKADKAKSNQRLNKMLGMLFNVSDEETEVISQIPLLSTNTVSNAVLNNGAAVGSETLSLVTEAPTVSSSINLLTTLSSISTSSGLLKEAFAKVQPEVTSLDNEAKDKVIENSKVAENGTADVSTTFTFTLKSPKQNSESANSEKAIDSIASEIHSDTTSISTLPVLSLDESTLNTIAHTSVVSSVPSDITFTSFSAPLKTLPPPYPFEKESVSTTENNNLTVSSSLKFPSLLNSTLTSGSPSEQKNTQNSLGQSTGGFNFSSSQTSSTNVSSSSILPILEFAKTTSVQPSVGNAFTSSTSSSDVLCTANSSDSRSGNEVSKALFNFGSNTELNMAKQTSTIESNVLNPLLSFPQSPYTSADNKIPTSSSSGIFSFTASNASASLNMKEDKESTVNTTSQLLTTPFVFGASLPSSSTPVTTLSSISKVSSPSLFSFTGSQPSTTISGFPAPSIGISSISTSLIQTQPISISNSGFNFNPSETDSVKTSSVAPTSNSIFGSNTLTFGANTFKPSVTSSSEFIQPQTTPSATSSSVGFSFGGTTASSNIFSFANSAKPSQANSTPFSFGSTTTTTSISAPAFGASIGGGFSFGGMKTTPSIVPQFGGTTTTTTTASNISTPSTFSFNSLSSKPQTSFDFSAPKTEISTASSNIFTFGSVNANSSPFGGTSTTNSGVFPTSTPKPPVSFNFGSETSSNNLFNTQPASVFGAADLSNKTAAKPLFGSNDSIPPPSFGSSNAVSPFTVSQISNPFNSKPPVPTFGGFGASKPENQPSVTSTIANSAPNQNPFQVGQNSATQNAAFSFGQSNSTAAPNAQIFQFGGPQGSFGTGNGSGFNFGSGNNVGGPTAANPFTVGAQSDTSSGIRRMKARAHRRR